jgi:hypothetical protein
MHIGSSAPSHLIYDDEVISAAMVFLEPEIEPHLDTIMASANITVLPVFTEFENG